VRRWHGRFRPGRWLGVVTAIVLGGPALVYSTGWGEEPMLHWHYIGYIDPRHPFDLTVPLCPPKPIRPVPADLVSRLADKFGVVVGEEVIDCGGYLLSHLGYFGQLRLHPPHPICSPYGTVTPKGPPPSKRDPSPKRSNS
jgi:hypothetical protein